MNAVSIKLENRAFSYSIHINSGLLDDIKCYKQYFSKHQIVLVTVENLIKVYAKKLQTALIGISRNVNIISIPDGEQFKTFDTLNYIIDNLLSLGADRYTTLIALGGGVVCDIAGFAAASYMRGISLVHIPTSLIAQVDAAIGGKTGINHRLGKNIIGVFYQPQAVIVDIDTLKTLPQREFISGLAEIIKYAIIADEQFFVWLEENCNALLLRDKNALIYAIKKSCAIKAKFIMNDEKDCGFGARALLNFGHTFAHAIELGMGFGKWLHGEAVACGMLVAIDLSCRCQFLSTKIKDRVRSLLLNCQLPINSPNFGVARYLSLMNHDKKKRFGEQKFILLSKLGQAYIGIVPIEQLEATLSNIHNHNGLK